MDCYILFLVFMYSHFDIVLSEKSKTFRAAALEHKLIQPPGRNATSRKEALQYMRQNLDIYQKNAEEAGRKVGIVSHY